MRKFMITVNGKSYEVCAEEIKDGAAMPVMPAAPVAAPAAAPAPAAPAAAIPRHIFSDSGLNIACLLSSYIVSKIRTELRTLSPVISMGEKLFRVNSTLLSSGLETLSARLETFEDANGGASKICSREHAESPNIDTIAKTDAKIFFMMTSPFLVTFCCFF